MIEQILNRQFVLGQLKQVRQQLKDDVKVEGPRSLDDALDDDAELEKEDFEETLELVNQSIASESNASSGQQAMDAPSEQRRSDPPAEIDDYSFVSRDPVISNCQSALEAYFEYRSPKSIRVLQPPTTGRRAPTTSLPVTDRSLREVAATQAPSGRRVFQKFSKTDAGWISSAIAMGIRKFRRRHPFKAPPATPYPIADRCRILVIGDWGSGLPRARAIAALMRSEIRDAKGEGLEQHVIHLGDVYYSGWKRECKKRFLDPWPVDHGDAADIASWALNGNHEMYSGGHAYYNVLLADTRFARQERSSLFSLTNKHWRILGLDTAWKDHELAEPEWVRSQIGAARTSGQKTLLLSHHQPFSAFESEGAKLIAALGDLLSTEQICAWFWGHEHRCILYKPHLGLPFGRCVGYSGVPVYQWRKSDAEVPEPASYEYRGRFRRGVEWWANFGFAVLDLDGASITARYIDENGVQHQDETIG